MKHNRLLALLTVLMLLCMPMAQATSHIAYFHQAEGVERCTINEVSSLTVPEGLEELYALFAEGNPAASVYVFRMPEGMALMSISCTEMDVAGSTQALLEQRDALATGLQASFGQQMPAVPQFELAQVYGQEALTAPYTLYIPSAPETQLQVEGQVTIFYRGVDLIEVWTAYPGKVNYLFDQDASALLDSDLAYLEELEASLDFSVPEEDTTEEPEPTDSLSSVLDLLNENDDQSLANHSAAQPAQTPYMTVTADDGDFRMDVPLDTVVVHPGSDENTVARARTLFADIEGGEACFDLWYQEVQDSNGWLLISREYGVAAQVYVNDVESFAGMTAEDLLQLEQPVLSMMQDQYDKASIADESCLAEIDGMEHAWLSYDVYKGDMNLLTFVLAAADDVNLYEIDIYALITMDTDEDALIEIITMMLETLDYLPQMDV